MCVKVIESQRWDVFGTRCIMHKRDDLHEHDTCTLITNNTMFRCTTSHNNMYLEYIFRVRQSWKRGNNVLTYDAKFAWSRKASEPIHQCRKTSFVVRQNTELCLSRDTRQKQRCVFALPCHIACTCRLVAADVPNDASTQYSVHIQTYYQQLSTWLPAVVLLAGAPALDGQCPGALSSNTDTLVICFANNMPCRLTPAVIHYRL